MLNFLHFPCGNRVKTMRTTTKIVGKKCAQLSPVSYKKLFQLRQAVNNPQLYRILATTFTNSLPHAKTASDHWNNLTFTQFPQHLLLEPSFLKRRYL